jgi:putative ABC transport system substrate-binding protein
MTDRRSFLASAVVGLITAIGAARAQERPTTVKRLGTLTEGAPTPIASEAREAWRSMGWVVGENLVVERRFARRPEELPALAEQLVAWGPDLVVTAGTPATRAMKSATNTIPVMFFVGTDPVESKLVASLNRPGGNLTGMCNGLYEDKKLQLLKEVSPGVRVIAYPEKVLTRIDDAARVLGLTIRAIPIAQEAELPGFFRELRAVHADGVMLPPLTWARQTTIEKFATEFLSMKMPAIGANREFVEAGGLLSFSGKQRSNYDLLAKLFDRLLRGANPADIAVLRPVEFDRVLNEKTASAFGLRISPALRHHFDEVIR